MPDREFARKLGELKDLRQGGRLSRNRRHLRTASLAMLVLTVISVVATVRLCGGSSDVTVLSDGFETGDFSEWTNVIVSGDAGAVVQQRTLQSGAYAAQLDSTSHAGSRAYLRKMFPESHLEVRAAGWFNVQEDGMMGSNVPLFRIFNADGERVVSLYRQNGNGRLEVNFSREYNPTGKLIDLGTWYRLELRAVVGDAGAGVVEVWLDGTKAYETSTASLGMAPILSVQLGNETNAQLYTLIADDIEVAARR